MKLSKFKQSVPVLMFVIIIAKLVGMLREVVLANYFGTSNISDAYLIASTVPTLLFYFIGHSISTAYIPMYNKAKNDGGEKRGIKYTNQIINISMILGTVFVILLLVWPELVIKIFAAGFDAETVGITAGFIRMSAASMYFMIMVSVLGGYLQANKSFLAPAAVSLPKNAVIIISIIVSAAYGVEWLGWGLLLSFVAEFLLLLPFALKKGFRYHPTISIKDSYVQETWYVVVPILLGMFVSQINKIVDRSLASSVCEGGVSALTYASVINNAVQEILVTGIITVLFSHCAEWVVKNEHDKVKSKLSSTINTLIMLLLPATVGVIILARPIVWLVLGRGAFDENSTQMTVGALCCYTAGLTFLAIRDTLVKVFYAYKKTKVTTIVAIISILTNIVLNFILYKAIGLNGLALATAISAVVHCVTLYVMLRKQIGDFKLKSTLITVLKSAISCVAMAIAVILTKNYLIFSFSELVGLIICVLVGIISYFICALVIRIEPLDSFMGILRAKLAKKN